MNTYTRTVNTYTRTVNTYTRTVNTYTRTVNTYTRTLPHVRPRRLTAEEDVVGLSREIGVLKETAGLQTLLLDVPA